MKMAAAELKSNDCNNTSHEEVGKNNISPMVLQKNIENYKFTTSDIVIHILFVVIFLVNILTDIIVATYYFLYDYTTWMYLTIYFTILPIAIIQIISLRWYQKDHSLGIIQWIMHILCLGILQRYFILIKAAIQGLKGTFPLKSKDLVLRMQNNVFTLSLLSSFLVDAPQSVIQLYILAISRNIMLWTSISVLMSLSSLIWTVIAHTKFVLKTVSHKQYPTLSALTVEVLWRSGFFVSRIAALVLGALCTKNWFFVLIGLHWSGMTVWLAMQKTHLCSTTWEERAYNCLIGMINCFDFLKLQSNDRSWYRICIFYSIMIIENLVFLTTYMLFFKGIFDLYVLILCSTAIVGGTTIGLTNMSLYYCMFRHTNSPKLCVLPNLKVSATQGISSGTLKSTKSSLSSLPRSSALSQNIVLSDEVTADKKSLLTNIVQNSESVEKGIVNRSFEMEPNHDSEMIDKSIQETLESQKRRGICSSMEADLEKSEVELDEIGVNLSSRKRRGICSLTQLCQEEKDFALEKEGVLNDKSEEKEMSSQEDTMKIESEPGNEDKKEDTRSHVSSIHDYENLCLLGVARPPWCIRSWKGYTDIETYIHDDSVVRDRRRDTLTSTATGTTLSSEYSEATYASLPLRRLLRRSRQDDYLDTLTYDLVDFESNFELEEQAEQPTLFAAKAVVIDDKGGMLALDTILEEHEDLASPKKPKNSLVATIDEINKYTTENSPRHIYYHRTESMRRARLATVLFENQYNNSSWRYSRCFNELDAIKEIYSRERISKIPLIDAVLSDSPILGSRTEDSVIKCTNEHVEELFNLEEDNVYVDMNGAGVKKSNDIYEELGTIQQKQNSVCLLENGITSVGSQESKHLNTQLLNTVSSLINNSFDLGSPTIKTHRLTPLKNVEKNQESPILKDAVSRYENFNISKGQRPISRPRRKFSLLRERFEPKSDWAVRANRSFTNHWSKSNSNGKGISIILSEQDTFDSAIVQEKENLARINFKSSFSNANQDKCCYRTENNTRSEIKEKRSVFLKQILSSPKFHGWAKTRTFSPNAKMMPKAV